MLAIKIVHGGQWAWPHTDTWCYDKDICAICLDYLVTGHRRRCNKCDCMTCNHCTYLKTDETEPGRPDSCRSCWSTD